MRKSESMNLNFRALNAFQQQMPVTGRMDSSNGGMVSPQPIKAPVHSSSSAVKLGRLLGAKHPEGQQSAPKHLGGGFHQTPSQRQYIKKKSTTASSLINEVEDKDLDSEQRAYATLQQMQTQPVPHPQYLSQSPYPISESGYSAHTFANNSRGGFANSGKAPNEKASHKAPTQGRAGGPESTAGSNLISKQASLQAEQLVGRQPSFQEQQPQPVGQAAAAVLEQTGAFQQEESLSGSRLVERATTPELTTPVLSHEDHHGTSSSTRRRRLAADRPMMVDAGVSTHICCHEQAKHNAVLQQKVHFLTEQISQEKSQAQVKELQFNKMIAALKQTAEENLARQKSAATDATGDEQKPAANPSSQDWQDVCGELSAKKEEVNELQEKVLELELKAEKVALDHKIKLQEKDDEISESRLNLKHKESDLRNANSQIERLNEDLQNRIQEALDRQSDRLGNEKQNDLDAMNRRNEQLIKQLVDNHAAETRQLRALLLEKEHRCREAEQQVGSLEIELRAARLETGNRFNTEELEEMHAQSQQANEMRLATLKNQFQDENQQLRDVIVQLEGHINQLQEGKSEADRKLIIAEDKISEVKKEVALNKIMVASQKEKEEKLQQTYKAQIAKERKTADVAVKKVKGVQKLERELNNKQILINQLKAKILDMERDEQHKSKILLMKRRQIEDEKTVLIKKQALRQRSMTRSNLSATRMQHKLETQQAVIATERESKKALLQEKAKLEKEIVTIKREGKAPNAGRDDSSRHNESMSMYFARSQGVFSPRLRADQSAKSFATKGSKTSRPQVFLSQQTMDHNQLYLSKQQSSNERTSSMGACSLQGGDSMVNIVEFEENVSPRRRSKRINHDASIILSTPFKQDEPGDGNPITNLKFRTKGALSHSAINPMLSSQVKVD